MKATEKEIRRATTYLRKHRVALDDIQSFRFMQRYTPEPDVHSSANLYGPGLSQFIWSGIADPPVEVRWRKGADRPSS